MNKNLNIGPSAVISTSPITTCQETVWNEPPLTNTPELKILWLRLLDHLETRPPTYDGLTASKMSERGNLVPEECCSERLVFCVERHRATAGATYSNGLPMPAYETHLAKYAFDIKEETISEISEKTMDVTVDTDALASEWLDNFPFTVTYAGEARTRYSVNTSGLMSSFSVSTLEEAMKTMTAEIDRMDHGMALEGLAETQHSSLVALEHQLCQAFINEASSRLQSAWNEADQAEDDEA